MIVLVHLDHYYKKVRLPYLIMYVSVQLSVAWVTAKAFVDATHFIGLTILGDFAISRDNGGV